MPSDLLLFDLTRRKLYPFLEHSLALMCHLLTTSFALSVSRVTFRRPILQRDKTDENSGVF